jgi:hypothetical protein
MYKTSLDCLILPFFAKRSQFNRGFSVVCIFESRGVVFIDENGGGPSVRLRKSNDLTMKKK